MSKMLVTKIFSVLGIHVNLVAIKFSDLCMYTYKRGEKNIIIMRNTEAINVKPVFQTVQLSLSIERCSSIIMRKLACKDLTNVALRSTFRSCMLVPLSTP